MRSAKRATPSLASAIELPILITPTADATTRCGPTVTLIQAVEQGESTITIPGFPIPEMAIEGVVPIAIR